MAPLFSPDDAFSTPTSTEQTRTEHILADARQRASKDKEPTLHKTTHIQFLARNLTQGFPSRYVSQDASQPWLMFWTLHSLSILQVSLDPGNRQRVVDKVLRWQHPEGGFGGGPGQAAHLLPTYASVCSLAIAGKAGPGGGWDQIDREKMYKFFMSLKQPDGSFQVAHHAEVDVRQALLFRGGIYCLLVTATLLDILTPELIDGTAAFLASCQTYEGGFASSSQPYYNATPESEEESARTLLDAPRPPLGEAHGGYAFCAIASLVIIRAYEGSTETPLSNVNVKNLVRWLVHMQGSEAEIGGFKGRTNKLVDGCYSWWVGGAFSLLGSLGVVPQHETTSGSKDDGWQDVDDSLFNRQALQEYILIAGQHASGGLVDKPPKGPDAYHTMYCLSGLSSAQRTMIPHPVTRERIRKNWESKTGDRLDTQRRNIYSDTLCWLEEEGAQCIVGGAQNKINATHPLFNLTTTHSQGIMAHFYGQSTPPTLVKTQSA